jgi:hypothetical protein
MLHDLGRSNPTQERQRHVGKGRTGWKDYEVRRMVSKLDHIADPARTQLPGNEGCIDSQNETAEEMQQEFAPKHGHSYREENDGSSAR